MEPVRDRERMPPSSFPRLPAAFTDTAGPSGKWGPMRSSGHCSQTQPSPHHRVRRPVQSPPSSSCLLTSGKRKDALSCFLCFQEFCGLKSGSKKTLYIYIAATSVRKWMVTFHCSSELKNFKDLVLKELMLISEIVKLMRVVAIFLICFFSKMIKNEVNSISYIVTYS